MVIPNDFIGSQTIGGINVNDNNITDVDKIVLNTIEKNNNANIEINGNLLVKGTTTTISSTNSAITDTLIELASGREGNPSNDSGLIIDEELLIIYS